MKRQLLALCVTLSGAIYGCSTTPRPAMLTTSSGVSVTLPAGAVAVSDPDHDIAFNAAFLPGQSFRVNINPFPVARTDLFPDVADYGRVTEDRVVVTTEAFTNPQNFDVTLRQFRGANGDFNGLVALATRPGTAVIVSLQAPGRVLDRNELELLKSGFRDICASLN